MTNTKMSHKNFHEKKEQVGREFMKETNLTGRIGRKNVNGISECGCYIKIGKKQSIYPI